MEEKNKNIKNQKIFIEPLEQRIMLDGAGASTFLDLIDERNQQEIKKNSKNKDIYKEGTQTNTEIPFTTVAREARNDRKNIVFIDSQVKDYREITKSFRENTEVYLINSNEDGFKRIDEVLKDSLNYKFRKVLVKGEFDNDKEIQLIGKTYEGNAGFHVVTPFKMENNKIITKWAT